MDAEQVPSGLIESSQISLEYQDFRLKDPQQEKMLLGSIAEKGIQRALWGIERETPDGRHWILLDGFKRFRCAKKVGIQALPWRKIGSDEAHGILCLLDVSNSRGLHILEQSKMVDSLHRQFGLGVTEIAGRLEKSVAWVSVRLGVLSEMDPAVRVEIFSGRFPARSYMYTLKHFTRVKQATQKELGGFVSKVSGHGLSGRQIDLLAQGYFTGSEELRNQIQQGDLQVALTTIQKVDQDRPVETLSSFEAGVIRDLQITLGAGGRIRVKCESAKLASSGFFAEAEILLGSLRRGLPDLSQSLERLYDRCREKKGSLVPSQAGGQQKEYRPPVEHRSQDGSNHY
jgi:hypothetical protein